MEMEEITAQQYIHEKTMKVGAIMGASARENLPPGLRST